jgi:hypothetical protein
MDILLLFVVFKKVIKISLYRSSMDLPGPVISLQKNTRKNDGIDGFFRCVLHHADLFGLSRSWNPHGKVPYPPGDEKK